jgi:diguanylate cyclase (GGDEF)-like protein/PAS domain S-box-containing protein
MATERIERVTRMAMNLLIARGSAEDVHSIVRELRQAGHDPAPLHVQTEGEFLAALDRGPWEAVLVHSAAPHTSLVTLARGIRDRGLDVPIIAVTPRLDTAEAVLALRAGATHCLARGELWRLPEILQGEMGEAARRRALREAEQSQESAEERYRELLGRIPALTYVARTDATRSTAFVSAQAEPMTGFSPEEWMADPDLWPKQVHAEDRERVLGEYRRSLASGEAFLSEYRLVRRDGGVVWWRDEGRLYQDGPARTRLLGGVAVDITSHREAEQTFRDMIHRDPLTGLANRALLQRRLEQALQRAARDQRPAAVLLIDLDGFREVNNTLGHQNGDVVIQEVGARLGDVVGDADRVARVRGDEFALLLPDADAALAQQVAGKVLKALEQPIMVERLPIEMGASIGIAVAPVHGLDGESILRKADLAMQAAKKRRSGFMIYSPECDPYNPRGLVLLGELRRALEGDQLLLHYQPKVDLKSNSVIGAEALVRWRHPKRGLVPPNDFITLAEQGGLIKRLTRWVLGEAIGQCDAWRRGGTRLPVSVNLSARNLSDTQLLDDVPEMLSRRKLEPEFLELEITETAVMADAPRAVETLRRLRAAGVGLAVDDFGTGYSSLVYLRKLPVNQIKIDKSFVIGMAAHEEEDEIIVRSTTDLGHHLGLQVVAEGVEDRPTFDKLSTLGCDAAQGYYMARPMTAPDLAMWLRQSEWRITRPH